MEFTPDYPAPYINLLYLLNTELRGAEAEAHIEKAKDVVGINKISLYTEWAYMLEYTGRFEEAIAKYKEIIPMQNNLEKLDQIKTDIERCRKKKWNYCSCNQRSNLKISALSSFLPDNLLAIICAAIILNVMPLPPYPSAKNIRSLPGQVPM